MPSPYAEFRAAVEAFDAAAAAALFTDDAVFNSPVVHKPYQGREALQVILTAVMKVFTEFRYTGEYTGEDGHVLRFACRVDDRDVEGVDILRGDGERLTELTVMVRPYSAATLLRERMAALLG